MTQDKEPKGFAMRHSMHVHKLIAGSAISIAVVAGAPYAASAVETPGDVTTVEQAIEWAQNELASAPAPLSADEGVHGYELAQLGDSSWDLRAFSPDTSWYDELQSDFTLQNASQFVGFQELVDGGTDFTGKTVRLAGDLVFVNSELKSIGGADGKQFNGTFDGAGKTLYNFKINSTADAGDRSANFGLFGHAGKDSVIRNVNIADSSVTVTRSSASQQAVSDIAALVGSTEGSVENCSVQANVTVNVDTPQIGDATSVVNRVGGVAGTVGGNVTGCSFSGTLTMLTNTAGSDAIATDGRQPGLIVAKHVGGVVAYLGDPARHEVKADDPSTHGSISGCSFTGSIDAKSPTESGQDRFGQPLSVRTEGVGGVVGYTQGSVTDSTCSGTVFAPQGDMVGGVVGSLRSISGGSAGYLTTNDYGTESDPLTVSGCMTASSAKIGGLHAGGGVVGAAGSHTLITQSSNAAPVSVYRWNKPSGGGVAGQSFGDITYSANTGSVKTAKLEDDSTASGYYVAGVAGMLLWYKQADGTPNTPQPQMYGCYNTGQVIAYAGMKSAALVGQNDGNVNNCLALSGTSIDNALQVDDSSSGTMGTTSVFLSDSDMRSTKATAVLNKLRNSTGWDDYFVVADGVNGGYPQLRSLAGKLDTATLSASGLSASVAKNAAYNGGEAIPSLNVSYQGKKLVQNADFYVVPQKGATQLGSDYQAGIVGIGAYAGRVDAVCSYGIDKGDLANCTVSIKGKKFNYKTVDIQNLEVSVTDEYGNELPSNWFTFAFKTSPFKNDGDEPAYDRFNGTQQIERYTSRYTGSKDDINMTNRAPQYVLGGVDGSTKYSPADYPAGVSHYGYYPVVVTPTEEASYTGSTFGNYKIAPASLMTDVDIKAMTWNGQSYAWNDKAQAFELGAPSIEYTGSAVTPSVSSVTYTDPADPTNVHTLKEGEDYRVIYGNPNSDTDGSSRPGDNVGSPDSNTVVSATVRFIGGGRPYDFDNFVNMYFTIHGQNAPAVTNIADCQIIADSQPYTGKEVTPVRIIDPSGKELDGTNFRVEYSDNTDIGTAKYTIRATRGYTGTVSGTFNIFDPAEAYGWTDVDPTSWYGTESGVLKYMHESGLVSGYAGTTLFGPYDSLSRAQAVTILWRFAEHPDDSDDGTAPNETGMPDVDGSQWYAKAANWAVKNGVVTGVEQPDGSRRFAPNDTITREQMCAIIANYAATLNGVDVEGQTDQGKLASMPDGSQVSDWARSSVAWALTRGVINGVDIDGQPYVKPQDQLVRIQMAAIMTNCTHDQNIIQPPANAAQAKTSETE